MEIEEWKSVVCLQEGNVNPSLNKCISWPFYAGRSSGWPTLRWTFSIFIETHGMSGILLRKGICILL